MRLNGWQRLWFLISAPFVVFGLYLLLFYGVKNENPIDIWAGISIAILWPALMYAIGLGIAWVRRGFRGTSN
jgi:uncharacterized membrane protein